MSHKTERGVFELKQSRILCVTDVGSGTCALVAAVEGLRMESLEELRSLGEPLRLVVTAHRGRAMGIDSHESHEGGNRCAPSNACQIGLGFLAQR